MKNDPGAESREARPMEKDLNRENILIPCGLPFKLMTSHAPIATNRNSSWWKASRQAARPNRARSPLPQAVLPLAERC